MMTKRLLILCLTSMMLPELVMAANEINCTASPDCASLGYTQTQCASGGIRCPFDKSKMFCVSGFGGEDFSFKTYLYTHHIVFSDGTTNTFYNADKDAIGIVIYVHPNTQGNHGIIMALNQPTVQTRDEAIKYCANYTTKGTKVGDWHLADFGELMTMQNYDLSDGSMQFQNLNSVLKTIPGAQALGVSYSYYYSSTCGSDATFADCRRVSSCPTSYSTPYFSVYSYGWRWVSSNSYTKNYAPGCMSDTNYSSSSPRSWGFGYYNDTYWSSSDAVSASNGGWALSLYGGNYISAATKTNYAHFRCVALF